MKSKLFKIKGDASFRQFYRKKSNSKSTVVVYSKKEKIKNLLIYDAINKLLIKNKIFAPKLYNHLYKKNYIEIEDFGNHSVLDELKKQKKKNLLIFKKIILLLKKIQKIKTRQIKNFNNKVYKVPLYSDKLLFNESKLFCDWYTRSVLPTKKKVTINKKIVKAIKHLIKNLKQKNNCFVHRDFHVSNLMIYKNNFGVIDSQDAVIGNKAYDLASLIDDVRYQTSNNLKNKIYKNYIKINKNNLNIKNFKNDFDILSVLRNLKIIGIFTRLAKRDKKNKYLKLIPYTWKLIEMRLRDNPLLKDLKNILDKNFSNQLRKKVWKSKQL